MDGAIRFFTRDERIVRKDAHVRHIGKIGKRDKIFRIKGLFQKKYSLLWYHHFLFGIGMYNNTLMIYVDI